MPSNTFSTSRGCSYYKYPPKPRHFAVHSNNFLTARPIYYLSALQQDLCNALTPFLSKTNILPYILYSKTFVVLLHTFITARQIHSLKYPLYNNTFVVSLCTFLTARQIQCSLHIPSTARPL